jgi:acyl carrier protein
MASTEEIRTDLAEIVNEVAGVPADDVQLDRSSWPPRRSST